MTTGWGVLGSVLQDGGGAHKRIHDRKSWGGPSNAHQVPDVKTKKQGPGRVDSAKMAPCPQRRKGRWNKGQWR